MMKERTESMSSKKEKRNHKGRFEKHFQREMEVSRDFEVRSELQTSIEFLNAGYILILDRGCNGNG